MLPWKINSVSSVGWGSWYDHVKGYWKEREKKNILYLFYEDMKEVHMDDITNSILYTHKAHSMYILTIIYMLPQNPRREVERIARYLDISVSDEVISRIVELTSFKNMKENPMANYSSMPSSVFDQSISPFMRKGVSVCS